MFFMVPEASNGSRMMFFHALVIQGPSQIDPGWIWETSLFHENFHFLTEILRPYFHENSHVHRNPSQSECTQTSSDPIRETILNIIKFYRADVEKNKKQN